IKKIIKWILTGSLQDSRLTIPSDTAMKRLLELSGVPHKLTDGKIIVEESTPLLAQLGIEKLDARKYDETSPTVDDTTDSFEFICRMSTVRLRNKCGEYIGCRMGRPEKARERKMQPAVHALYPIGNAGGRERSVNAAAEKTRVDVEVSQFICQGCRRKIIRPYCSDCNMETHELRVCGGCGYTGGEKTCPNCGKDTRGYQRTYVDVRKDWMGAISKIGKTTNVKGVIGMISETKIPEPLEKGLLRALNEVYVFKDGTIRFDATDVPLTQFKPCEVGVDVEKLKQLGYDKDYLGKPVTDEHQILQLKPQDIVVSEYAGTYMVRVASFIDQLLTKYYGMEAFYNVTNPQELIGHVVVGLAPHTSAGVMGRIVGYTKANVIFAHPFWHAAKRRNADGDEDSIMLLLDTLLNFSLSYLPEKRGGKMDAPLVITTLMNPREVDDEAHKMEVGCSFDTKFYEKALQKVNPSEVEVKIVRDILGEHPYDVYFTHDTGDISGPVTESRYVTLDTMKEKIDAQLAVAEKIRAIDEREVAKIVIDSHFLRDTYGNLRAFSRQRFRCVKCNENYRRVPLIGKCTKCGGKLLLTVSQGNITKYLDMSMQLAQKYGLSDYLKSRLRLLKKDVESLTTNDLEKQISLADYM
ncbi:MAG: DNA polymerase II large subunit, partial [Candidatus Altiarchaeota archaeon]|nr:DNA polymerase II large subunit [Candidatus Altiarchaeota archaeon]